MSSVDSEDRARCPILSCGTYLMLERTREGTRAGEGEGGRAALCKCLGARRRDPRSLSTHRLSWAARLQKHWASNLASVLAPRPGPPWKPGSDAAASPAPWWPPSVRFSALNASLLRLLARSLPARSAPAGGGVRQPGRAQARRARRMTGVIYIASTWLPFAVASDFSRVLPGRKQEALCSRQ